MNSQTRRSMTMLLSLVVLSTIGGGLGASAKDEKDVKVQAALMHDLPKKLEFGQMKDGRDFVQSMSKTAETANDYTFKCIINTFRDGKVIKEEGIFYYKRPSMMKMEVTEGAKKGAVAVLGTDGKVRGHLGGMLKMFSGTIGKDSNLLKSANGFSMMDSDYETLLRDLQKQISQGATCLVTSSPVAVAHTNEKVYVLEVYKQVDNDKEKDLTQRVFIDPKTGLPEQWNLYKQDQLFSSTDWKDVKLNIGLSNEVFSLKGKKDKEG
ncbi:MAG TPA: hypothetical protein EYN91_17665 [Candidatus Melainabacteria bacterium]|nr:hypothetical protein [Candidatus Melainabacteria bacterium]HIN65381.1 hypothetical protein [Candidatus Obscuribacterales bacterium]